MSRIDNSFVDKLFTFTNARGEQIHPKNERFGEGEEETVKLMAIALSIQYGCGVVIMANGVWWGKVNSPNNKLRMALMN